MPGFQCHGKEFDIILFPTWLQATTAGKPTDSESLEEKLRNLCFLQCISVDFHADSLGSRHRTSLVKCQGLCEREPL